MWLIFYINVVNNSGAFICQIVTMIVTHDCFSEFSSHYFWMYNLIYAYLLIFVIINRRPLVVYVSLTLPCTCKIPIGSPPHLRANLSTPQGFSLKLSSIPGAGMGAWTDQFVPRYTVLGVYEGVIHTRDSDDDLYSWQVTDTNYRLAVK